MALIMFVSTFLLIFSISYGNSQTSSVDPNTYGPYKVRWRYYELCNGPKKENLTLIMKALSVENDIYKGIINVTFLANARVDMIKITVIANKDSKTKNLLWNYKVDKPCQHYSISYILSQQFKTDNCIIKKGIYHLVVDFTEDTNKFLGNNFFYGDYIFKVVMVSTKGNLACILFNPIFSKK